MNIVLPFAWEIGVLVAYFGVLLLLTLFGVHRLWIIARFLKHRHELPQPCGGDPGAPRVLVQLPIYNEGLVAARLIRAVAALDYPHDLLEIQLLDDSTDNTPSLLASTVREFAAQGIAIAHVQRGSREGYKAGALAHGLKLSTADLVAIFDADFVPASDFLKKTVPYFADDKIGLVQTRWEHLNRDASLLTKSQGMLIDGHFVIEQTARSRSGCYFSFNGTAGIWRRSAIDTAGGWRADTLTEDLDLSYRAQMIGWRFVFLCDYTTPAELPENLPDFKIQQHRWTKGGMQTLRLLLPRVLRAHIPLRCKIEAAFHMGSNLCYLGMAMMSLLLWPAITARMDPRMANFGWLDAPIMLATSLSFALFYTSGQVHLRRGFWRAAFMLPSVMVLGAALSVSNAFAVVEGWFERGGEFVRTPKSTDAASPTLIADATAVFQRRKKARRKALLATVEWFYFLEAIGLFAFCVIHRMWVNLPFISTFVIGFGIVALPDGWAALKSLLGLRPTSIPQSTLRETETTRPAPIISIRPAPQPDAAGTLTPIKISEPRPGANHHPAARRTSHAPTPLRNPRGARRLRP